MRLHRDAKAELIASVPLFARCSKRELRRIAAITDEVEIPAGKVLIHEGDLGRDFYVLVEGTVDVDQGGRRLASLGPGDFVGEMALLQNSPRNSTVRTSSPVRALAVSGRDFWSLLDSAPPIQRKLLETLAERLASTTL